MNTFTKFAVAVAAVLSFAGAAHAGTHYGYDVVEAYDSETYTMTVRAGESVTLYIDGDNDTDLDLYVYDGDFNLIDCDIDELDFCIVSWTPLWTGTFYIVVENLGEVWNEFEMYTR